MFVSPNNISMDVVKGNFKKGAEKILDAYQKKIDLGNELTEIISELKDDRHEMDREADELLHLYHKVVEAYEEATGETLEADEEEDAISSGVMTFGVILEKVMNMPEEDDD